MSDKAYKISKESVDKLFPKKDIDILGYESPVKVIMGQMQMEQENNIFKAIQDYGVDVDKDELIKALQYDRDQYEKGYINGYIAKASEIVMCKDCIYRVELDGEWRCSCPHSPWMIWKKPMDYCSCGERKEG